MTPLLQIRGLSKSLNGRPILRDIDLELDRGRTLALAGRSGAGKTTLARLIAGFETPDSGEILLDGRAQLIFQQPAASLNPRFTAQEAIAEPLLIEGIGTNETRRAKALELMETVGLRAADGGKRARDFSGGECQRIAIARALAFDAALWIFDESFTGLDLALQGQIAFLLGDLRRKRNLAFILITHHWALIERMADDLAVMDGGAIVESGPAKATLAHPQHAATRELAEAHRVLTCRPAL
jgi:ABC-type dipeptide/oligopeptide/nickel transport system ATPase subunit